MKTNTSCPRCGAYKCAWKHDLAGLRDINGWELSSNINPVDGVVCNQCNRAFVVRKYEYDDPYVCFDAEFEAVPDYCPFCGHHLCDSVNSNQNGSMKPIVVDGIRYNSRLDACRVHGWHYNSLYYAIKRGKHVFKGHSFELPERGEN